MKGFILAGGAGTILAGGAGTRLHPVTLGLAEEIVWRLGFLSDDDLRARAEKLVKSGYGTYLLEKLDRGR